MTTPDPITPERVTLTERIKALLDEHRERVDYRGDMLGCTCGDTEASYPSAHRAHVAEVIAREAGEREAALRALADEGFVLVRFYGDVCPTCHTQSNAHVHNLTAVLDQGDEEGA